MRYLMIAIALAVSACSGGNDTVVKPGDPSVSAELRDRKGPLIVPIIKGDKELVFISRKERPDMPVPEGPNFIVISKIDLEKARVILEGISVETKESKTFEIIINQSELLKEDKVDIGLGDSVEISFVVWEGKRRYYISANYTKRLSLAEWVEK